MACDERMIANVYRIIDRLIGAMLIVLVGNVLLIILSRQIGMSVAWAYDLARWLVIWMAFIGSVSLTGQGGHLTINFIYAMLPSRAQLLGIVVASICTAVFAGVVAYYGGLEVYRMYAFNERSMSGLLPAALGYSILPIGFGLIALASAVYAVRAIKSWDKAGSRWPTA